VGDGVNALESDYFHVMLGSWRIHFRTGTTEARKDISLPVSAFLSEEKVRDIFREIGTKCEESGDHFARVDEWNTQ
jgi:hypothetical protein